jgi:hypothetical protein
MGFSCCRGGGRQRAVAEAESGEEAMRHIERRGWS